MAKKDKEKEPDADGDGENAEAQGEGEAAPKKGLKKFLTKKILMIAAPALLLVLAGGGAGVYFFVLKPHDADKEKLAKAEAPPLTPPQVAFSDVPDILVNIQSSDGTPAYLKLSLSLELDNDLEKTGMTALMPRLVDQFQSYLRELRIDDLKGSEGVLRLKEELLRRVNAAAAPYKVRDVLLKQMIIQ
ncbi:MAG TPA: flagellar basal body-associated FliL family protein [Rhizomicrobium sp.]|nr:flagellar basal body-associated FliL family protein [Rhizomicrobium sp.]